MENTSSNKKYRIKSVTPMMKILFVIEEVGQRGEFRLLSDELIEKGILDRFDASDVARIMSAIENEKNG